MKYLLYNGLHIEIEDCFVQAICPTTSKPDDHRLCGLNICVVIKRQHPRWHFIEETIEQIHNAVPKELVDCYLVDVDERWQEKVRIPFQIHGGNLWSDKFDYGGETCCYFGYVHPLMFGNFPPENHYKKDLCSHVNQV